MNKLLAFYHPDYRASHTEPDLRQVMKIAHDTIMIDLLGSPQEIQEVITGEMVALWRRTVAPGHGKARAQGENQEAIYPIVQDYAQYYYEAIFVGYAQGERSILQHQFLGMVRACTIICRLQLNEYYQRGQTPIALTLTPIIKSAIQQARNEGLDENDVYWMAIGALLREGRVRGVIADEPSNEMLGALEALVKHELRREEKKDEENA